MSKITGLLVAATMVVSALSATTADAAGRRVRIINNTNVPIHSFYASNVSRQSWEEDILGNDVIPAGGSMMINIDDGSGACLFDFKAVFDDGDVLVRNRINVCRISSYTYYSR